MKIKIIENGETVYNEPANINKVGHFLYSSNDEKLVTLRREKDEIVVEKTKLEKETN